MEFIYDAYTNSLTVPKFPLALHGIKKRGFNLIKSFYIFDKIVSMRSK